MAELARSKNDKLTALDFDLWSSESQARQTEYADELAIRMKQSGFTVLKNIPIAREVVQAAMDANTALFSLPDAIRVAYKSDAYGGTGFTPFASEKHADEIGGEPREFWAVNREAPCSEQFAPFFATRNRWPSEVPGFKPALTQLAEGVDALSEAVLTALAQGLALPADFFNSAMPGGMFNVRCFHYPPVPKGSYTRRMASHVDFGVITIIVGVSGAGFEVFDSGRGRWLPITPAIDEAIVLAGEVIQYSTNDLIRAPIHRITKTGGLDQSRYSIVCFFGGNESAVMPRIETDEANSFIATSAEYARLTPLEFALKRFGEFDYEDFRRYDEMPSPEDTACL